MKRSWLVLVPLALFAVAGAIINANLTFKHASKAPGPAWFESVCAPEDESAYNCETVLESKWSVFSFATMSFSEADSEGKRDGVPVALLGWWYFSFLAVWFLAVGVPAAEKRWLHMVPTVAVSAGLLASIFFLYILYSQMETRCAWCLVSHAINFVLFAGVVLLWRREPALETASEPVEAEATADSQQRRRPPAVAPVSPHPGTRLVLVTVVLALVVMYAEYSLTLKVKYKDQARAIAHQLREVYDDAQTQLAQFQASETIRVVTLSANAQRAADQLAELARSDGKKPGIIVRADDPTIGDKTEMMMKLVVFSDFQCPACRKLAAKLKTEINPAFDNLLRIIWKHLPLCTKCNPNVSRNVHPHACDAARAAEAARLQGGNDAFWKAHDLLFESYKHLGKLDYRKFATDIGLDPDRFVEDMASQAVIDRIAEDIVQAKALGLNSTPGLILGGKKVRGYMLNNKLFMGEIKKFFLKQKRHALNKRAKSHTQTPAHRHATPSTPSPRDAP